MILDEIIEKKRKRLEIDKMQVSINEFLEKISKLPDYKSRDFYKAIKRENKISIIAEVKKASPSKGVIKENFDVSNIALEYEQIDIQAISVLTEKDFFLGDDRYLNEVRQLVRKPILRKDFIIDPWQIYQSKFLGADAILLIASVLSKEQLKEYVLIAKSLDMQCIVEASCKEELGIALESGTSIIGVNNRDLKTFQVDIKRTEELVRYIPKDIAKVSESGIKSCSDLEYLKSLGVDAVLIGETFMRAPSIIEKLYELRGEP